MPVLGQIWLFFGRKSNFWGGRSKTFGTLVSGNQGDTFFVLKTLIVEAPIGRQGRRFFWQKMGFNPKITQNFLRDWYYLGKGNFFFWTTFSGRGQNMVRIKKLIFFFEPKISVIGQNIRFLPYDPHFGQRPVCSPRRGHLFPTLATIFRLSIPELQQFS